MGFTDPAFSSQFKLTLIVIFLRKSANSGWQTFGEFRNPANGFEGRSEVSETLPEIVGTLSEVSETLPRSVGILSEKPESFPTAVGSFSEHPDNTDFARDLSEVPTTGRFAVLCHAKVRESLTPRGAI